MLSINTNKTREVTITVESLSAVEFSYLTTISSIVEVNYTGSLAYLLDETSGTLLDEAGIVLLQE